MPNFEKDEPQRSLQEICADLGEVYYIEKDAKDELGKLRLDFFLGATLAQPVEALARKVVGVPDSITAEDEARAFVERYNSGWRIVEQGESGWIIEEDPEFLPYSVVVEVEDGVTDSKGKEHPGYVITKTIVAGSAMFDNERLLNDDLDLYYEVTEFNPSLVSLLSGAGIADNVIPEVLENSGYSRQPKNPDDLTPEQSEAIKAYSFEGSRSLRLNVNYAKPEELGEG